VYTHYRQRKSYFQTTEERLPGQCCQTEVYKEKSSRGSERQGRGVLMMQGLVAIVKTSTEAGGLSRGMSRGMM
jgi:hypothetical protein